MPNQEKRTDLARYDSMDTEALQEILRADASKTEAEVSDQETILYIMEVLAERRKAQNQGKSLDEAWEIFRRSYEERANNVSEKEPVKTGGRWKKSLVAAAAVVVLLLGGVVTAKAFGVDLWQTIVVWGKETMHIGYAGQVEETGILSPEYDNSGASLQEALEDFHLALKLVPTWLPEGYTETEVSVDQSPVRRRFLAIYTSPEGNMISIRIADYLSGHPSEFQKSGDWLEVYESAGVPYYIFQNIDQLNAVWLVENLECCISGPVSLSDMKKMIDSIEKG